VVLTTSWKFQFKKWEDYQSRIDGNQNLFWHFSHQNDLKIGGKKEKKYRRRFFSTHILKIIN